MHLKTYFAKWRPYSPVGDESNSNFQSMNNQPNYKKQIFSGCCFKYIVFVAFMWSRILHIASYLFQSGCLYLVKQRFCMRHNDIYDRRRADIHIDTFGILGPLHLSFYSSAHLQTLMKALEQRIKRYTSRCLFFLKYICWGTYLPQPLRTHLLVTVMWPRHWADTLRTEQMVDIMQTMHFNKAFIGVCSWLSNWQYVKLPWVRVMAWRRAGARSLTEPMLTKTYTRCSR